MSKSISSRHGYLLTEMVVVIGVSSTLAAIAVGLLGTLMRIDRAGRRHLEETSSLVRLSKQFRRDVAAAEVATLPAANRSPASELRLRLPAGQTVSYRAEPGRLVRLVAQGQAPASREMFVLPVTAEARFAVEGAAGRPLAVLAIAEPTPVRTPPEGGAKSHSDAKRRRIIVRDGIGRRGWTIEALVGRDLRHAISRSAATQNQESVP